MWYLIWCLHYIIIILFRAWSNCGLGAIHSTLNFFLIRPTGLKEILQEYIIFIIFPHDLLPHSRRSLTTVALALRSPTTGLCPSCTSSAREGAQQGQWRECSRLTVDHHVDEKYGKLALNSIEKLRRERETRESYSFLICRHVRVCYGGGGIGSCGWLNFN